MFVARVLRLSGGALSELFADHKAGLELPRVWTPYLVFIMAVYWFLGRLIAFVASAGAGVRSSQDVSNAKRHGHHHLPYLKPLIGEEGDRLPSIERILNHIREPTEAPLPAPAREPLDWDLEPAPGTEWEEG